MDHKKMTFEEYIRKQRSQIHYCKHIMMVCDECIRDVMLLETRLFRGCDRCSMPIAADNFKSVKTCFEIISKWIELDIKTATDKHISRAVKRQKDSSNE